MALRRLFLRTEHMKCSVGKSPMCHVFFKIFEKNWLRFCSNLVGRGKNTWAFSQELRKTLTRNEQPYIYALLTASENWCRVRRTAVGWKISAERKFSDASKVHIVPVQMMYHTPLQLFGTLRTNHLNEVVFLKTNCFLKWVQKVHFLDTFQKTVCLQKYNFIQMVRSHSSEEL